jgi:hypothetical protein
MVKYMLDGCLDGKRKTSPLFEKALYVRVFDVVDVASVGTAVLCGPMWNSELADGIRTHMTYGVRPRAVIKGLVQSFR